MPRRTVTHGAMAAGHERPGRPAGQGRPGSPGARPGLALEPAGVHATASSGA
jgi:hypothetical protein